jgi:hypothetical protein
MEYWNRPERRKVVRFRLTIAPTLQFIGVVQQHSKNKGI